MSRTLGDALVRAGIIDEIQLAAGLARQKQWGGHLLTQLVRAKMVDEERLVRGLANRFSYESLHPLPMMIERRVLDLLPPEYCSRYLLLPLEQLGDGTVRLVVADPTDLAAVDAVQGQVGQRVDIVIGGPVAIADAVQFHYYGAPPRTTTRDVTAGGADDYAVELPPEEPLEGGGGAEVIPLAASLDVPADGIELGPEVELEVVAAHQVVEVGDLLDAEPTPEAAPAAVVRAKAVDPDLPPREEVVAEPASPDEVDTERVILGSPPADEPGAQTVKDEEVILDAEVVAEDPDLPEPTSPDEVYDSQPASPDDIPTGEPTAEEMPTMAMTAMTAPGSQVESTDGHFLVVAAEPVGEPPPGEAPQDPSATTPPGEDVTADFPARARAATPDDPARGPDDSSIEERLARAERLAREVSGELRDLVNLLVEQKVFTRDDYKAWRGRKW